MHQYRFIQDVVRTHQLIFIGNAAQTLLRFGIIMETKQCYLIRMENYYRSINIELPTCIGEEGRYNVLAT